MMGRNLRRFVLASLKCGAATWAIGMAGSVYAQSANAPAPQSQAVGQNTQATAPTTVATQPTVPDVITAAEIVVTGTLIRGQAPVGSEMVSVSSKDIAALGIADTSQLLGSVAQDASFNSRPQVGNFGQYQSVNAPLLRYLGGGSSGSNSTLLLVDGVRMPGMGILQTSADIDAIAPGAIVSMDIVPDGGSATYGSDAVGGVVNMITRTRFDGLEVGGHFGGAEGGFKQYDASLTTGKKWDSGSVWVSYQYAHHDLIMQDQRPYDAHDSNYTTGALFDQTCSTPNFAAEIQPYPGIPYYVAGPAHAVVNGVPTQNAPATCDESRLMTLLPSEDRHSLMAGFDQDVASNLVFNLKAYYVHRATMNDLGPYNDAYTNVPASYTSGGVTESGLAEGNLNDPVFQHAYGHSTLDAWAVIPKLTWKIGHDWQNVTFFNYGRGVAGFEGPALDSTSLITDASNGTFNPLTGYFADTSAGQNALAEESNFVTYSRSRDTITNGRTVFDGPVFALPGGEVRAAVGAELMHETFSLINGTAEDTLVDTLAVNTARRTIHSAFGELSVPIVGEGNRMPGIYALTFSAAGRFDHYSDFGGTFNPKLAVKYQPAHWLTVRGDWGKSFQAPSLASTSSAIPYAAAHFPTGEFGPTPTTPGAGQTQVLLLYPGGGINLQPQKARSWEIGFDVKPPVFAGLSASLTYYNIDFTNRIGTPEFYASNFYALYPNSYIIAPAGGFTTAQIQSYLGNAANQNLLTQYINNPGSVYALENGLTQNLSATKTSGLDFNINYTHPTSFGTVFGGVAGTYLLTFNTQSTPTSPFQGIDANEAIRLRMQTTIGFKAGPVSAQINWKLTGQYAVPDNAYQTEVSSFSTINMSIGYSPKLSGLLSDTTFSVNVDNLLNTNPPFLAGSNGQAYGYSGFTIGRYIQFGLNKKF